MRKIIILAVLICGAALAFAQNDAAAPTATTTEPGAAPDATAAPATAPAAEPATTAEPSSTAPSATTAAPPAASSESTVTPAPAAGSETTTAPGATPEASGPAQPQSEADMLAEITRLSAKLEEANGVIDELRTESYDLKNKADDAEKAAKTAQDEADTATQSAAEAEKKAAAAQAVADAEKLKERVAELEAKIASLESGRDALYGKLASFGTLRLDPSAFPEQLWSGFADAEIRLGVWTLSNGVLSQTDKRQYFSRLTFPIVQSSKPVLYSFETKTGAKGWVGTGIHFFAEGVKKPRGFGEGKSLLVWLTRDLKVRGNDGTYLQVYRSDNDVSMERVLDAKVKERLEGWNRVDVLYEPANEFVVLAVNGTIRAAYRTYFGIGTGVTMSLRTLGEGVQFRNLEVRR